MLYQIEANQNVIKYSSSSHSTILPSSQDWLCCLTCEIKAIQIESKQNLFPPPDVGSELEDAVPHPGQRGAGARPVERARRACVNAARLPVAAGRSTRAKHSPGTTRVVVCHEAESIHYRGQLLKLLHAKHTRLPLTDRDGGKKCRRTLPNVWFL